MLYSVVGGLGHGTRASNRSEADDVLPGTPAATDLDPTVSSVHVLDHATLRKTVASFLDDAHVSTRKISDQLGHSKVSMTQDRYLGRRLTDRQTSDVLDDMFDDPAEGEGPITGDPEPDAEGKESQ